MAILIEKGCISMLTNARGEFVDLFARVGVECEVVQSSSLSVEWVVCVVGLYEYDVRRSIDP